MKNILIPAIAAALLLPVWQTASAAPAAAPDLMLGAGAAGTSAKSKKATDKKSKKDKKDKADKKDKKDKKAKDGKKDKKDKKAKKAADGVMAQALKDIEFFNGEPNLDAEYFIYLQSASWCGPCNMEMPHVVKQHGIMQEDGRVEIILVGHDKTKEKAVGFLEQYGAKFPGMLVTDEKVSTLPGFAKANGIPNAIIVDADGNVVYAGHPGPLFSSDQWKLRTIDKK